MRTSDNNPGIKSNATKLVLQLIESYNELVPLCLKERMIRNVKDAKARVDLVTTITKKALVPKWKSDASMFRQNLMTFIVSYLKKHPHADVRNATMELLVLVAQHQQKEADFKAMSTYLETDSIKLLQQELKKKEKKKLASSTSNTVKELRALAVKSNKGSTTTAKKPTSAGSKASRATSGSVTRTESKKTKAKPVQAPVDIEEEEEKT
jgi:virulence-associated protein VapD